MPIFSWFSCVWTIPPPLTSLIGYLKSENQETGINPGCRVLGTMLVLRNYISVAFHKHSFFLKTCRNSSHCILSDIDPSAGGLSGLRGQAALLCAGAALADWAAALDGRAPETLPSGSLPPGSICLDGVLLHAESSVERTQSRWSATQSTPTRVHVSRGTTLSSV